MMKQIFFIISLSLSFSTGYSQYFPVDTAKLNTAYRNLIENPKSKELSEIFFDAFPSTWIEFIMTYQYMWDKEKKYDLTMCNLCGKHIDAFLDIFPVIPDSIYCDKLISLAIGGRWDADLPSALQRTIIHKIMSIKPEAMFRQLSKQTRGFQLRFWQFYWSSLEANNVYDKDCNKLKKMMSGKYPNEVKIMTTAFEYAWKEMMYPVDFYPHKTNGNLPFNVRKKKH
jgi:hypothetical protein